MLAFLSSLLGAKTPDAYPRLSDNLAASAHLEVRKLLHGHVDGMFVVPRTQQLVAVAGGYLWKFSPEGDLQDTLRTPGGMFTSGISFTSEHYVDWVFTGHAQRKTYGPAVDGNGLTQAQVIAALQRAEVVEFGKKDDHAWAYLWAAGRAWKMELTKHLAAVDTWCHQRTHSAEALRWHATCYKGLKSDAGAWTEVEPDSFAGYGDAKPRVEVVGFDRRKYYMEEGLGGQLLGATVGVALKAMGVPGSLPGRYWFGDAHTRLRVGSEVLQFKAFIPYEDGDYRFLYNMRWWEPATAMPGASPWFSVHMRTYMERAGEEGLLKYYEKDIGLYVVRPRGKGVPPAAQGDAVAAWRPVFAGSDTGRDAVTGTVEFAAAVPTHRWLRSPPPRKRFDGMPPQVAVDALWPSLRQLPKALTVKWRAPDAEDGDPYAVLHIELEQAEVQAAFDRLRGAKAPLELVVQVPELHSPAQAVQLVLRSGNAPTVLAQARQGEGLLQVPLTQTRVVYTAQPIAPPPKPARAPAEPYVAPAYLPLLDKLKATAENAQRDPAKHLQPWLEQARTLAQHPDHAQALAPGITAVFADLLNRYNNGRKLAQSATLVRYYLAQVYPLTSRWHDDSSQAYNQGVMASQTLAFAIHSAPDRDLVEGVMRNLVGTTFDPAKQTNATLMYNLACYYAVANDKPKLLQSVAAARRLGKPADQFMRDTDFAAFLKDADFLAQLAATP
ncbi:MAG: hypothetical protein U5M53_09340 [Rhodoferax sp.]|nr:hypothetical protein [Rhodoferax sp.]